MRIAKMTTSEDSKMRQNEVKMDDIMQESYPVVLRTNVGQMYPKFSFLFVRPFPFRSQSQLIQQIGVVE